MRALLLLSLASLSSCGPEAVEIARGPVRVVQGTTSCSHFGYCYTCAPGISSFKLECKFKLSHFCPGQQGATLRVQDVTYRRGEETYTRTAELEVVSTSGACR